MATRPTANGPSETAGKPVAAPTVPATGTAAPDDDAAMAALGLSDGGMPSDDGLNYMDPDAEAGGPGPGSARAAEMKVSRLDDAGPTDKVEFEITDEERLRMAESMTKGLKADPTWPRVICMKLGLPDDIVAGLFYWAGSGMERIDFRPFQRSAPLHPRIVTAISKDVASKPFGFYWKTFWQTPPVEQVDADGRTVPNGGTGDCKSKMSWFDKASQRRIETCVYANCPRHPRPNGIHHSIWQAQRFLSNLKTDSAINNYIRNYDPRGVVAGFADLVKGARSAAQLKSQGYDVAPRTDIIF